MLPSSLSGFPLTASRASRSSRLVVLTGKLIDSGLIALCLAVTIGAWSRPWSDIHTIILLVAIVAFTSFAGILGLYHPWHGEEVVRRYARVWIAWAAAVFVLFAAVNLSNTNLGLSHVTPVLWLLATPLALCGWRFIAVMLFVRLVKHPEYQRKVVVWGRGETADRLVKTIRESPHLGLFLVDHVVTSERDSDRRGGDHSASFSGDCHEGEQDALFEDLVRRARQGDFNILYIARQGFSSQRLADFIEGLADTAVSVYLAPDFSTIDLFQGHWSALEGIPLISVFETPFLGVDGHLKRLEDIILSILFIAVAGGPMLLIALLIKITSRGPVFFRQCRYGIGGTPIAVLKFRTMTVCENGDSYIPATRNDPRVTRLGGLLRKTSLDELPQFFNVLRGEMSIVGPRPHPVAQNEFYRTRVRGYMLRHKVKPGITGWAQINGWRGETDELYKMEKRVEYDFWYIRNWSLALDIKIILLTALGGFTGKNAY
ncbi:undecaprenyl-phosphate glucose phosphotransferase [uncultured Thiodictyon sp.]|uniref:undecaprenyl-phosphate glucose phosphotransferase n=1 Tax=uncultured Thiodictyon sp. TaxID=1846217 RepID=UPI0025E9F655|nr:undecaprenyl-phosphate glucose phosphotransferase [uncultured Thiodictyon sp.]